MSQLFVKPLRLLRYVTFFNNGIPGDDQATRNAMQRLLGEVRARL